MRKNEPDIQFALKPVPSRCLGWGVVLLCGLGFATLTFSAVRVTEQLLSLGLATILIAVASRMLWMLATIRGLTLEGRTLTLSTRNAGAIAFDLPGEVVKVSRFGPDAECEVIVVLRKDRRTYRVVTSHYEKATELRRMLAERLHF